MATKKAVPAAPTPLKAKKTTGRIAPPKEQTTSKSSVLFGGLERIAGAITDATTSLVNKGGHLLDHTQAGKIAKGVGVQAVDLAGKVYEEAAATGKKIGDNLSGAEVQARITALVEQQRRYNDILATRLAEALDRIEKLEKQLARRTRER